MGITVLHIVEAAYAGVGRHILDLAKSQADQGMHVDVAVGVVRQSPAFAQARSGLQQISWHEMRVDRSPSMADRAVLASLGDLVRVIRPDIIHGHSTKGGLLARAVARRGAAVVYTPHAAYSMNPRLGRAAKAAAVSLERGLSKRTDAVIAVSPEEADHLAGIGIRPDKIHTVPNGIVPTERADPQAVRMHLGLPHDRPVVGFVGRLDDQKAPDDLAEVFLALAKADPMTCFAVVGDGPQKRRLEDLAYRPPLQGRLHLLGHQPGTWAMSGFDVLLLPSLYEGFPYVLVEAAHLGIPVVASDRAWSDLLAGGPTPNAVAPVGDITALTAGCVEMLNLVQQEGRSGFGRDLRFTASAMERATFDIYRRALDPVEITGVRMAEPPTMVP